mmetsp:Transcript_9/g.17  ORF Transcript_9/g.17 Transcript_9/m.17 type:complete len:202 (-) Transcript_9:306-911(-)
MDPVGRWSRIPPGGWQTCHHHPFAEPPTNLVTGWPPAIPQTACLRHGTPPTFAQSLRGWRSTASRCLHSRCSPVPRTSAGCCPLRASAPPQTSQQPLDTALAPPRTLLSSICSWWLLRRSHLSRTGQLPVHGKPGPLPSGPVSRSFLQSPAAAGQPYSSAPCPCTARWRAAAAPCSSGALSWLPSSRPRRTSWLPRACYRT